MTELYLSSYILFSILETVIIKLKFTHRDIASLAGISRETASREWEILERKKIIKYEKKQIIIEDIKKLEKELSTM